MMKIRKVERGQALVLIVFGMVGLIAVTALALDGGNAYSDRRHAQNASDTAVMATGLTKIRTCTVAPCSAGEWSIVQPAGFTRAADNGYNNNGTSNAVNVYQCTDAGATCNLPAGEPYTDSNGNGRYDGGNGCGVLGEPYTDTNGNGVYDGYDPADFVQVTITSHVNTYLARIVGVSQLTNSVQALAKAVPPRPVCWYNGNALVATQPACHPPAPYDAFTLGGGSVSIVTGAGGVFVNSNCSNAFTSSNGSSLSSVNGTCVVGGVVNNGTVNPPPDDYCTSQVDPSIYQLPTLDANSCPTNGSITKVGGVWYATPGNYAASFPNAAPAGTLRITKGIYCLHNGFDVSSSWDITTDLDGNGTFDGSDGANEGALFWVTNGGLTLHGGATVHLGAINKTGTPQGIKGYLFYLPPTNSSAVTINGGTNEHFVGTILAPSSLVTLNGGAAGDSLDLECQIIGGEVKLTGNGSLNIQYNQGQNAVTYTSPILQPFR